MIIYDFDDTIYDGDSSIDFYKYCFIRKPFSALISLIVTAFNLPLYMLKIISHREMKEKVFKFVTKFNNLEEMVEDFWDENEGKIKKWYLAQYHKEDVVISASFDFIIKPICHRLNIKHVITTDYNIKTGKIIGPNCHGKTKIIKFEKQFPGKKMKQAYSDSPVDRPILEYAKEGFVVIKEDVIPYEEHIFDKTLHCYLFDTKFLALFMNSLMGSILLILFSLLLKNIMNILYSFSLGYLLTTICLYLLSSKTIYELNPKINGFIKFVLANIPSYVLLLCFVYTLGIVFNISSLTTMLLIIVIYFPSMYLTMKLLK